MFQFCVQDNKNIYLVARKSYLIGSKPVCCPKFWKVSPREMKYQILCIVRLTHARWDLPMRGQNDFSFLILFINCKKKYMLVLCTLYTMCTQFSVYLSSGQFKGFNLKKSFYLTKRLIRKGNFRTNINQGYSTSKRKWNSQPKIFDWMDDSVPYRSITGSRNNKSYAINLDKKLLLLDAKKVFLGSPFRSFIVHKYPITRLSTNTQVWH